MAKRDDLLNRKEAAAYLGVSESWLTKHGDDGPTVTRVGGKVVYTRADLDAYLTAQRGAKRQPRASRARIGTAAPRSAKAERSLPGSVDVTGAFASMTRGTVPGRGRDKSALPEPADVSRAVSVLSGEATKRGRDTTMRDVSRSVTAVAGEGPKRGTDATLRDASRSVTAVPGEGPKRGKDAPASAPATRMMTSESMAPLIARSRPSAPPPLPSKARNTAQPHAPPPTPPGRRRP